MSNTVNSWGGFHFLLFSPVDFFFVLTNCVAFSVCFVPFDTGTPHCLSSFGDFGVKGFGQSLAIACKHTRGERRIGDTTQEKFWTAPKNQTFRALVKPCSSLRSIFEYIVLCTSIILGSEGAANHQRGWRRISGRSRDQCGARR